MRKSDDRQERLGLHRRGCKCDSIDDISKSNSFVILPPVMLYVHSQPKDSFKDATSTTI